VLLEQVGTVQRLVGLGDHLQASLLPLAELEEIVSFTSVGNVRSRRVMEKLGMVRRPQEDFDHPRIPQISPLCRHVLYRLTHSAFSMTDHTGTRAPASTTPG
jgi:hypothetical protein